MNILQKIAGTKKEEVARLKRERGIDSLREGARSQRPPLDFTSAIHRPGRLSLIAEIKKASPSKGVLRADFDVEGIAGAYTRGGASALSVLTDEAYFQGALGNLRKARKASALPALRKDFLIDEVQVYEAREAGADAVLLIAALLSLDELKDLASVAGSLGMSSLVEVHNGEEMDKALAAGAKLLGINNRDLGDFTVSLDTSIRLLKKRPEGIPVVSESGIFSRKDALELKAAGASAVLVGEAFMTAPDIERAVRAFLPEGD